MMKDRTELSMPALSGLLDFWLSKCSGGNPPVSSTITPAELRPWKDNIVIFEIVGEDDYVYAYYGKALEKAWGHSRLGRTLNVLPDDQRKTLHSEYESVLRERLPVARVYTGSFDGIARTWERLVLPLSSDGGTVDKLLVAAYEMPNSSPLPTWPTTDTKKAGATA
jgi:hypothetical protein